MLGADKPGCASHLLLQMCEVLTNSLRLFTNRKVTCIGGVASCIG